MKRLRLLFLAPLCSVAALAADHPVPAAPPASIPPAIAESAKPAPSPASLAEAEAVLKAMRYDDTLDRILAQQKRAVIGITQRMTARLSLPGTSPEEIAAFQQKAMDAAWGEIKPAEIHAEVARIYSEIFTQDQLYDIASFYGTPAGQALVSKTPEVQQKIVAALMPRLMRVVPKIQQMARDFAEQQQAKAKKAAEKAAPTAKAGNVAANPAPAKPPVPATTAPSKP